MADFHRLGDHGVSINAFLVLRIKGDLEALRLVVLGAATPRILGVIVVVLLLITVLSHASTMSLK